MKEMNVNDENEYRRRWVQMMEMGRRMWMNDMFVDKKINV